MADENYRAHISALWQREARPLKALWQWALEPTEPSRKAARFNALADWAGAHKRNADHDTEAWRDWKRRQKVYRRKADKLGRRAGGWDDPGVEDGGWHPDARRVGVVSPAGSFSGGPPRLVWHTTEGYGLPSYSGSNPHFTIDPETGVLYQHQSVEGTARALVNASGGVETNSRSSIQVEIIGFAGQSQTWDEEAYGHLAELARWIEKHCGVARECGVSFAGAGATPHMSNDKWLGYAGHCGHQHVPENAHWDPGAFRIDLVLDK